MIPFSFSDYRICVKCGSKSVEMIDKFNRPTRTKFYPVTKMRCNHCGAVYYIKWVENESGNKIPVCADVDSIDQFKEDIIQYAKSKRRQIL